MIKKLCHEIGNPLTLIDSNVQLMHKKYSELASYPEWLQLREDLENLRTLFHSLSQYNNCELGSKQIIDLYDLIYDVCDSFESYAAAHQTALSVIDVPLISEATNYHCDSIRLRQAIANLIKNAIEHASKHTTVFLRISTSANGYLLLSVENTGQTISHERLQMLSTPFYSTKQSGYGLGLPITEQIIRNHGGYLQMESNNGNSCFSLALPTA